MNLSTLIHKKLKLLIEFFFDKHGNLFVSEKLDTLLNQYGIYELDKFNEFLNIHLEKLNDFYIVNEDEDKDLDSNLLENENFELNCKTLPLSSDNLKKSNDQVENNDIKKDEESEEDELEEGFFVPILIIFFKRKNNKTAIFFLNPLINKELTAIL